MLCYRAECAIKNIIAPVYKNTENDDRKLIQEIFTTDADIAVDNQAHTFTVTLQQYHRQDTMKLLLICAK